MRQDLFLIPAIIASLGAAAPTTGLSRIVREESKDPDDLGFIQKIAAIGDSYSAGIGAGDRLGAILDPSRWGDWKCSRYDNSYPALINRDLFGNAKDHFQFHSCSGALVQDVINDQVGRLDKDQDVLLLSAGGNDAELVWILNHCVYQFFSPTPAASKELEIALKSAAVEQPEIAILLAFYQANKEKFERSCDQQLRISEGIIKSLEFSTRIGVLIEKSKEKLKKDSGAIYYTGYAKFWDTDIAKDDFCSKRENSWSFFYNVDEPTKIISDRAFLSKDRRNKMNSLVDLANKVLKETVASKAKKNSKGQSDTVFIDYDGYFGDVQGRFCTKGVDKSEIDRKQDLVFYPLNIWDPMGSRNFKREDPVEVFNGTFEEHVDNFATLADFSGARYRTNIPVVKAKAKKLAAEPNNPGRDGDVKAAADGNKPRLQKRMSILPDGFGRVFHPTIAGHGIMAKLVLWNIAKRNAQGLKAEYADEVVSIKQENTCPIDSNIDLMEARCIGSDGDPSNLPANVFNDYRTKGVFSEFCKKMDDRVLDSKKSQSWKVNAKGEHQKGSSKMKRTPPPDPGSHKQMIDFKWTPAITGECKRSCHDAFLHMASACGGKGGGLNIMAVRAQYNTGCGTFSYEITGDDVPTEPATCVHNSVGAPKRDGDVHGKGTSVEAAYKKFCKDNDGKTLEDKTGLERKYQRHAVASYGVEDRVSFWVSASFIKGCRGKVTIKKDTCMEKFSKGLDCYNPDGVSFGYSASEQCVEYAIDTGFKLRDDGGPWNNNYMAPAYPPPEDTEDQKLVCSNGQPTRTVTDEQLNKAIDHFCKAGADIKGFGKNWNGMVDYPPEGQPQFYPNDQLNYHLTMGASTVNQGDNAPYKNMDWCKNYDWKLVEDDCRFVMRKGYHECTTANGVYSFKGFDYTYRCVHYKAWGVNIGKN